MKKGILVSCVALFFLLSTCKQVKHSYQPAATSVNDIEEMVFLTFSIKTDSLNRNHIRLIEKKIVTGKLKSPPENSNLPDRIVVKLLNREKQELSVCSIDHPLLKRAEYPNGQGGFESKTVTLKEAEFFIRIMLYPKTEYIKVDDVISNLSTSSTVIDFKK